MPRYAPIIGYTSLAVLLANATVLASRLAVPSEYSTIQLAIEAAVDGDVITVAAGTYGETIDFLGKAIRVEATSGPAVTTIDANGLGTAIRFESGEGSDTELTGFTITGGQATQGGGVRVTGGSSPRIVGCSITGNTASDDGGGVYVSGSTPQFIECQIRQNSCGDDGGGLLLTGASVVIENCLIAGNIASGGSPNPNGGGIHSRDGSVPVISESIILGNHADEGAGGIRCFGSPAIITNCFIIGNTTDTAGGGLRAYDSDPVITNCTFHANSAGSLGGAIDSEASSYSRVTNCIFWENSAPSAAQINLGAIGSALVTFCDVQGGFAGANNIDADPIFIDAFGVDGMPGTGDEDLHLSSTSPCIDSGDNSAPQLPTIDFDGDARIADGDGDRIAIVDIGADESSSSFRRGDVNGDGVFDVSDAVFSLAALFVPGSMPASCADAADANDDGVYDVSDAVFTLAALFVPGSPPPPEPGPLGCGADATSDALPCVLYDACP